MLRNIKTAVDFVAGAEGYEVASLHASAFNLLPIINSDGKVIADNSDCVQIIIVLKKRQQKGDCDEF